jgi:protein phosphatase 1 regulatory subunit 7
MCMLRRLFFVVSALTISTASFGFSLELKDKNLQACILELAEKNHWGDAESVSNIECHSKNIRFVDGIEVFTKLKRLSLYNNDITELTLTQFVYLQHLNVAKNKIDTFSVSSMPALEELYVFNNKLPRLALADLPNLKQVKANNNLITNFTYKTLPALEKLYLFGNKMTDMDIYNLQLARYVDVRQNPMPDKLYEDMEKVKGITFLHDGNAADWQ